jgi:glycosyltransferase involved in cell wall biosynthesis
MKIGFVVPGGFAPGGRENVIPALLAATGALAARHDVHVFAFGAPGPVTRHRLAGAEIHQLGNPVGPEPARRARGPRRLARLGLQLRGALAHAASHGPFALLHAFWAGEPGLLASGFARRLHVPLVVSVGGGEAVWLPEIGYGGAGSMISRAMLRLALGQAAAITAGTAYARDFLPAPFRARARVVPLGIVSGQWTPPAVRPPGPPFRLLHVGSINAVKDHAMLLRAFARVVARLGEDVTLDCVGEDRLNGRAQAQAHALGLDARVRFHGYVSNAELAPLYRAAHLHVISSRYESQSVVALEAAATELPTVGTAVGLLPTLAPDAALTVAVGDDSALADATVALLADEPRRRRLGAAAAAFARAHDAAATAAAFEDIYRGVT